MPQPSLFEGFEGCTLSLTLRIPPNKPGGQVAVSVSDELYRVLAQQAVGWERPRDLAGLPDAVKQIVTAWLYGSERDVVEMTQTSIKAHCPRVPDLG